MCTLIFAWRHLPGAPLLVAANRDEAADRPASPPGRLAEDPAVVGPRDEVAGGTWIGYAATGLFAGITNRDGPGDGERSRGLLVTDALASDDVANAVAAIEAEVGQRRYDGFNLVLVDERAATLLEWDGATLVRHDFDPGLHVVVNAGREGVAPKATAIAERLAATAPDDPDGWLDAAAAVLRDHELEACIHGDGYGTRSSSLLRVNADGHLRYLFADGPPCRTSYRHYHDGPM